MKTNSLKRTIFITVAVILITALMFCIFTCLNPKKCGLLPDFERASEKLEHYDFEWYKEICSTMIDANDKEDVNNISQEYIISNSISFLGMDFINIKIYSDQTGEMTRKFRDAEVSSEGQIKYNEKISLSEDQTAEIVATIENNDFWNIPTHHPDEKFGFDGNTMFIEGVNGHKYNMITMWIPDEKYEIRKIYDGVIDCAEKWGLNADYYYLSYGISKEHFNQDMY